MGPYRTILMKFLLSMMRNLSQVYKFSNNLVVIYCAMLEGPVVSMLKLGHCVAVLCLCLSLIAIIYCCMYCYCITMIAINVVVVIMIVVVVTVVYIVCYYCCYFRIVVLVVIGQATNHVPKVSKVHLSC